MIATKKFAYSEMLDALNGSLINGDLVVGDCLPTEKELAEQFSISVTSVRQGISILSEKGIVKKRRGSGTYVRAVPEELAAQASIVPKDAVGVFYDTAINQYHPYFSELRYGISETLVKAGWNIIDPNTNNHGMAQSASERSPQLSHIGFGPPEQVIRFVTSNRNIAGIIAMETHARILNRFFHDKLPIVVPNTVSFPISNVCYDLDREFFDLLLHVVRRGAKTIAVIDEVKKTARLQRSLRAIEVLEGLKPESLTLKFLTREVAKPNVFRSWLNSAYRLVREARKQLRQFDALVVNNDFELQGALDALDEMEFPVDQLQVAGIINKNSQISTIRRFDAIVLDGYAVGETTAQLLIDKISGKVQGDHSIILKGRMSYEKDRT